MHQSPAADELPTRNDLGGLDTPAESGPGRPQTWCEPSQASGSDLRQGGPPAGGPPPVSTHPGPDPVSGGALAPEGPGTRAEPPRGSGYLDTTPNRVNPADLAPCRGYWLTKSCTCSRRIVWAGGCGRRGCPWCGYGKSQSSGRRLFERIYHGPDTHIQVLVLTCPIDHRQGFSGPDGARTWGQYLRDMIKLLQVNCGLTWAYCRSHPCGEDGKTFAPHANLLWASTMKGGLLDPALLSSLWSAALSLSVEVVLHASYINLSAAIGPMRLEHACSYVERAFPGWSWQGQWARWYGQHVPALKPREVRERERTCCCCGSPFTWGSPADADLVSIAGLETLLLSGQPVHPAEARAWSTTPTESPPIINPNPAPPCQGALFDASSPAFSPGLGV